MADNGNTVVLVHTAPMLVDLFNRLGSEILPGTKLKHVVDEPLLQRIRERGHLSPEDAARLQEHVDVAKEIHANAVLVTCSSVSPCVDQLSTPQDIPVFKIDEAMLKQAVATGTRVGVIATAKTTLEPTRQALLAQAKRDNEPVEVEVVFVPDAFDLLLNGDGAAHDRLVKQAILNLAPDVDVIVLAQASMVRVLDTFAPNELPVKLLSSPQAALAQVKTLLP